MRKVLVAGLDVGIRASLAAVLDAYVFVDTIATVSAGLQYLTTSSPEVVILDIGPPDLDSMCFLHTLRSRVPACQVVVVSAPNDAHVLQELAASRIDGLLRRPFHIHELLERVTSLLVLAGEKASLPRLRHRVSKAVEYVSCHYSEPLTVGMVASAIGVSPSHLAHLFRAEMGLPLRGYVTKVRVEVAKHFLCETNEKLDAIAELTGFCDASHLSRVFCRAAGLRPGQYRCRAAPGTGVAEVTGVTPPRGDDPAPSNGAGSTKRPRYQRHVRRAGAPGVSLSARGCSRHSPPFPKAVTRRGEAEQVE